MLHLNSVKLAVLDHFCLEDAALTKLILEFLKPPLEAIVAVQGTLGILRRRREVVDLFVDSILSIRVFTHSPFGTDDTSELPFAVFRVIFHAKRCFQFTSVIRKLKTIFFYIVRVDVIIHLGRIVVLNLLINLVILRLDRVAGSREFGASRCSISDLINASFCDIVHSGGHVIAIERTILKIVSVLFDLVGTSSILITHRAIHHLFRFSLLRAITCSVRLANGDTRGRVRLMTCSISFNENFLVHIFTSAMLEFVALLVNLGLLRHKHVIKDGSEGARALLFAHVLDSLLVLLSSVTLAGNVLGQVF